MLRPERPLVGTGLESQVARDSGMVPITKVNGTVSYVDANEIVVKDEQGNEHFHYLQKYQTVSYTHLTLPTTHDV